MSLPDQSMDDFAWIEAWSQQVAGKPCWMVRAGGCTGSRFLLDLGAKIPRAVGRWNSAFSAEANENRGEYCLHVGCANWALGISRPYFTQMVTNSNADCSPEGPMVAGLELLIGNSIKSVTFDPATCDLNVYFEEWDLRLKVWGEVTEDDDGYSLHMPGRIIGVDGPGRISHEVLT